MQIFDFWLLSHSPIMEKATIETFEPIKLETIEPKWIDNEPEVGPFWNQSTANKHREVKKSHTDLNKPVQTKMWWNGKKTLF